LVLKVKKTALALTNTEPLNFEFKWSDNMQEDGNIMDFYVNGDVAPAGRFNYIYKETENSDGYLLPYNPTNVNKGLKCQIYNQYFDTIPEFDNFKADSTNFPLKPDLPVLTNSFGVQYKSYIDIAQTGNYRFTLSSNSKAQIIINNKKLVKSDGSTAFSGEAKLLKGKHQLILQYISKPNSQQNLQLTVQNTQLNSTLPDTIFYKKNVNPTCSFTLNGNQRYYSSIDSVVTVNAQDVDGKIAKIELFDGNQLFYQTQQKSKISGVGFGVGDHNVYARIYDNDGAVIDTKSISFTVKDPFQTPGKMIMEDYANGESISIISSNDTDGGKSIKSGYGFAEYYINVPQNGIYSVSFRVPASTSGTKKINIYFDNVSAGSVSVGAVGNTYPWYSVSKECSLTSGIHKMRLSFSGIVTIHYVDFSFVTAIDETAQTNLTVNYNEDLNNLSIISPIEIVSVRIANMLGENVQVIAPASNTNRMYLKCEIPTGIYVLTVNLYNGARKEIKFIKK
jgi:hypothetical protein